MYEKKTDFIHIFLYENNAFSQHMNSDKVFGVESDVTLSENCLSCTAEDAMAAERQMDAT